MSVIDTSAETSGSGYELGSVNVDSLKEILLQLSTAVTFTDEASKVAFENQVASIAVSGDPRATADPAASTELTDAETRIAELEAQLLEARKANPANQGQ